MKGLVPYTINAGGTLIDLSEPQVMGILNVTPDSFYSSSRMFDEEAIACRTRQILDEGGTIIDVGAYSTRPGSDDVSEDEEARRLRMALATVRKTAPEAIVSIDTFRASIARMCVEEFGANIINDVSGGDADNDMFSTVAALGVPYILMHIGGTINDMHADAPLTSHSQQCAEYMSGVMAYLTERLNRLDSLGAKDVIIDPGFGFGKSMEQNYEILRYLEDFKALQRPLLVGVSRKSMIYRLLGTNADNALNGTTVCNTIALLKGASILRVHDVKACREAVEIVRKMYGEPCAQ